MCAALGTLERGWDKSGAIVGLNFANGDLDLNNILEIQICGALKC